eukprot:jgi/Botrbrau1/8512/Bobra.0029s0016.1
MRSTCATPLTGGGMTVAPRRCGAPIGAPAFAARFQRPPRKHAKATYRLLQTQKAPFWHINTLANALYQVFCDRGTPTHESLRQACFDYLKRGGSCSDGPIAMLGGAGAQPLDADLPFLLRGLVWSHPVSHGAVAVPPAVGQGSPLPSGVGLYDHISHSVDGGYLFSAAGLLHVPASGTCDAEGIRDCTRLQYHKTR